MSNNQNEWRAPDQLPGESKPDYEYRMGYYGGIPPKPEEPSWFDEHFEWFLFGVPAVAGLVALLLLVISGLD